MVQNLDGMLKNIWSRYWGRIILILVFLLFIVPIIVDILVATPLGIAKGEVENWIGFFSSYWGGVLGGLVGGVFTLIGILFTIHYYKEQDEQRKSMTVIPCLNFSTNSTCRKKIIGLVEIYF